MRKNKYMKVHTTNYFNTLIEVAEDCPVEIAETPKSIPGKPSVAAMQYEILTGHPYEFTSDEVLFQVYANRNDLLPSDYDSCRTAFFSKGQPCFRTSPLAKRYGFGVHSDSNGRVAIYSRESATYEALSNDTEIVKVKAMRSSKK